MLPAIDGAVAAMSEPMVSHDCVGVLPALQAVANSVKVVQSGQGADEVFVGYNSYPPLADGRRRGPSPAYTPRFFDPPDDDLAAILERERRPQDPSRDFVPEHLARDGRPPHVDAALRIDSRSCWSTSWSNGWTT